MRSNLTASSDNLIAAIRSARMEEVEKLLKQGVDIDALAPRSGYTPLAAAAMYNMPGVASLLLDMGALVDKKDSLGYTPLAWASGGRAKTDMARLFIAHGASIHEKTNNGKTALMVAAFNGASDTVSLLIDKGAALNEQNDAGETALLLAVRGLIAYRRDDHIETVRRLMAAGADCGIRDNNGFTPLDLAIEEEYSEIVEIIKEGLEDRRNGEEVRRNKTLERQAYLQSHAPKWSLKRGPRL